MRFPHGAQQADSNQVQDILFSGRQRRKISVRALRCGNDGVMVCHSAVVNHTVRIAGNRLVPGKRQKPFHCPAQVRRQIPGVRAWIRRQPFFIQGLHIIQRLLCRVVE